MASLSVENYVKVIYSISARKGDPQEAVATGEIAAALRITPGAVTSMLKTLSESRLATYTPYEGVRLTDPGRKLALVVLRRHRLIELFLSETLRMSWDEVHEEAEHLEHAVSDRLIERIDAYLNHPQADPHGDPIPRADGTMPDPVGTPLAEMTPGRRFQVVRVVDQDPAFLRYLTDCGIDIGAVGALAPKRPESGALLATIGPNPVALGVEEARKLLVVAVD